MFANWKTQHSKMSILCKLIRMFNEMLIKIQGTCFIDISKFIQKCLWEDTGLTLVKSILTKKKKLLSLILMLFI